MCPLSSSRIHHSQATFQDVNHSTVLSILYHSYIIKVMAIVEQNFLNYIKNEHFVERQKGQNSLIPSEKISPNIFTYEQFFPST